MSNLTLVKPTLTQRLLEMTNFLSIADVAKLLAVHYMTVRTWVKNGKLPAVKVDSHWRIDPVELAGWLKARTTAI